MADTRFTVGMLGNAITGLLFLCPWLTILKIRKENSVQEFKPDPYLLTLLNCSMWMLYGLPFVRKDNILVLSINCFGLLCELIYIAFFFYYSDKSRRVKISYCLANELVLFVGVLLIILLAFHEEYKRSQFIGVLCVFFNIVMYISPLTVVFKVMKTKSVKFMPLGLTIFSLANGGIWLIYAFLKFDLFIVIPNVLGITSGIYQLLLYAYYWRKKPAPMEEKLPKGKPPPKEIQMDSMV